MNVEIFMSFKATYERVSLTKSNKVVNVLITAVSVNDAFSHNFPQP